MVKLDYARDDFGYQLISLAINGDEEIYNEIKINGDCTVDVTFIVGGVELDFNKVSERIKQHLGNFIASRANYVLEERYGELEDEICHIKELLTKEKEKIKMKMLSDEET